MTPPEFEAIAESWKEYNDMRLRDDWERARILATISVQPHLRTKLTPQALLPLPWDNTKPADVEAPKMSAEERKARFTELVKQLK